jgi:outer membrane protein assembly factor BamC
MNRIGIIFISLATVVLAGCSYLESYFPDKEKDYQYTTEIPMINYPAELRKNQPAVGSPSNGNVPETASSTVNPEAKETAVETDNAALPPADNAQAEYIPESAPATTPETSGTEVTPADESDGRDTVSSVEIIKYDDGESRLRIGAGYSKSWRVVNKALSRNTIEVTERNHDQAQIVIQYDPDEKKVKDDSFMDEISFIFKGIDINDREYVLKLEEHNQQTDVIVLNEDHLPLLNDDAALRLLKVMADTIKADLAEKAK